MSYLHTTVWVNFKIKMSSESWHREGGEREGEAILHDSIDQKSLESASRLSSDEKGSSLGSGFYGKEGCPRGRREP